MFTWLAKRKYLAVYIGLIVIVLYIAGIGPASWAYQRGLIPPPLKPLFFASCFPFEAVYNLGPGSVTKALDEYCGFWMKLAESQNQSSPPRWPPP